LTRNPKRIPVLRSPATKDLSSNPRKDFYPVCPELLGEEPAAADDEGSLFHESPASPDLVGVTDHGLLALGRFSWRRSLFVFAWISLFLPRVLSSPSQGGVPCLSIR